MPTVRGVLTADVRIDSIECDARAPPLAGIRAHISDLPAHSARGDRVMVIAQLAPRRRPWNPDLGDPRPGYARRGYALSGSALVVEIKYDSGATRTLTLGDKWEPKDTEHPGLHPKAFYYAAASTLPNAVFALEELPLKPLVDGFEFFKASEKVAGRE